MPYRVSITQDAARDIEDLFVYLSRRESPARAARVLDRIEQRMMRLSDHPERGTVVRELADLGIHDYRELVLKPYRIIYRTMADTVYVMVVSDGRRDMQTLLQRRLMS